jgi:hypothetical protein
VINPNLSLAISMHSNKGVYALLVGSGISRASGIPTGWEVSQKLIRRVALIRHEDCGANPDDWFRQTFGLEPGYSEVLEQVTGTSAERTQLLRSFMEPSEEERSQGFKLPTEAHQRIASLVSRGFIRVIITTNFDRLLEQALDQIGIGASVIASADAVSGAIPLAHSQCTIVKVHGDYLDTRLKNTVAELDHYPEQIDRLLDRVFDEYGLIVCGWSAAWDPALRRAMERAPSRRFTTYWTVFGSPSATEAQDLMGLRKASAIQIADANTFFSELDENVIALESHAATEPISADVAVARLKRYLPDPVHRIALNDLISKEAQRVVLALREEHFSLNSECSEAAIWQRMQEYEAQCFPLLRMAAITAFWATPEQDRQLLSLLTDLKAYPHFFSGYNAWGSLRLYPCLMLFYVTGIASLANENYRLLSEILTLPVELDPNKPQKPASLLLHTDRCLDIGTQCSLFGNNRQPTPLLKHMFEVLKQGLKDLQLNDARYEDLFDEFDYIRCLAAWDAKHTTAEIGELESQKQLLPHCPVPLGRFAKESFRYESGLSQRMEAPEGPTAQIPPAHRGAPHARTLRECGPTECSQIPKGKSRPRFPRQPRRMVLVNAKPNESFSAGCCCENNLQPAMPGAQYPIRATL